MERLESQVQAEDKISAKLKTRPKWISDTMWQQCQHLEATLPLFEKLCRSIITNQTQWTTFNQSENTYKLTAVQFTNPKGKVILMISYTGGPVKTI